MNLKTLVLIASILCGLSNAAIARTNRWLVYSDLGYNGGNYQGVKWSINGAVDNVSFGFSLMAHERNSPNVPSDYQAGLVIFGPRIPQQTVTTYAVTAGWLYDINPYVRLNLKGGLGMMYVNSPSTFTPRHASGWLDLGPNYEYTSTEDFLPGLIINPTIEFPLGRAFGFYAGAYTLLNPIVPGVGADIGILFGRVRTRFR
jgi:hypothetical protein